jgi:surfeit locus 1 family protein
MAKGQSDTGKADFVPSGLKVRGAVSTSNQGPVVGPALTFVPPPPPEPIAYIVDAALEPLPGFEETQEANRPPGRNPGFEPMAVLTLLTAICLAILIWLGSWQWGEFARKSAAPTHIVQVEATSVAAALETSSPEYRPVLVEGLMDSRTIKVAAIQDSVRGYRLFSPVVMEVGSVFVDRGFVNEAEMARVPPASGQVRLNGVLRLGAKANAYTPDNEPARDVWYWPDLTAMANILMIRPGGNGYYVALKEVDPLATGTMTPNPYADSKGANKIAPERHLGYALTWWGFGLALIGVYIGLHVRTGRLRLKRTFS